jgi:hypothetical protein
MIKNSIIVVAIENLYNSGPTTRRRRATRSSEPRTASLTYRRLACEKRQADWISTASNFRIYSGRLPRSGQTKAFEKRAYFLLPSARAEPSLAPEPSLVHQ